MTTTDLWVTDGEGQLVLSCGGGLDGPAVAGMTVLQALFRGGSVVGELTASSADVELNGSGLRLLLEAVRRASSDGRVAGQAAAALERVDEAGRYQAHFVEV